VQAHTKLNKWLALTKERQREDEPEAVEGRLMVDQETPNECPSPVTKS